MELGKIVFCNNTYYEGKILNVSQRIFQKISNLINPELKEKNFAQCKQYFYFHLKENIEKNKESHGINSYTKTYDIIIVLNKNKKWIIKAAQKDISIKSVDILKE